MLTLLQSKENSSAPELSERLCAVARGLPKNGVICDVGSDHGALPLFLLREGLCSRVIVTDLNEAPLFRAKIALEKAGLSERSEFVLTDGIADILPMHPNAFVIAGMGGDTIAGILSRGLSGLEKGTVFALQPMTKEERLRAFLYENGFFIEDEIAVLENGKVFLVLFVRYDAVLRNHDVVMDHFGEYLLNKDDEQSRAYIAKVIGKMKKRLNGLRCNSERNNDEIALINKILSRMEDIHECS